MSEPGSHIRYPLMGLTVLAVLAAAWAGLARLGWRLPTPPGLLVAHGPLTVSGFLGTLIGLERAVVLGRRWPYVGPPLTGLVGLVSIGDVVKAQVDQAETEIRYLRSYITGTRTG